MTRPFKRRTLIIGSLAVISFARANSTKVWRIALVTSSPGAHILDIIRTSLRSLGYEQDKDFVIDFREASGHFGVLPALVDELIALRPDLIIAEATPAIAAVQKATTTIPVIMAQLPTLSGRASSKASLIRVETLLVLLTCLVTAPRRF